MKNIWKESDLISGLYIVRESSPKGSTDLGFKRTVCFKLGFCSQIETGLYGDKGSWGYISFLTDGWYCHLGSKEAVLKVLNEDEYGFRPLTKEEYIELINSTNQGFY